MPSRSSSLRAFALVCCLVLVAAACGGGGDDSEDSEPTTTSTTTSTTTTKPAPPPVAPLTGAPVTDPAVLNRPALLVKINNADGNSCETRSRPQVGLDQADIVIEEEVEGGITRFVAVYHSTIPETVGPVRSARSSDVDLIQAFNHPLFAWSGNNGNVGGELGAIEDSFVAVGHSTAAGGNFFRDNAGRRCAPSNLFVHPADLYTFAEGQGQPPTPVVQHLTEGQPATIGASVSGVRLKSDVDTAFVWNGATASWDRFQRRTPHLAAGDVPVSPQNVVILDVEYRRSSADAKSPEAISVGTGPAHVYLNGQVIDGTWTRDTPQSPWVLKDAAGAPLALMPGKTWIQLANGSGPTNLDAAGAAAYTG